MKKYNMVYISIISVTVLFFILSGNYKKNVASTIDNRYLAEFPEKFDESFTTEISDYVQDRIGCRDLLISLYTNFNNRVFKIFPNHMYGKHENLFDNSNSYIASYQHLNGDDEWAEYFTDYIYKLEQYCNQKDIEFLYMLNPDKCTVYSEEMPDSIGVYNAENLTDQIKRKICEKDVRHVFVDEVFLNEKSDQSYFNKKYDVDHWSDYGRIIGVNAVLKELSLRPLSVENDFSRYEIVKKKQIVSAITINDKLTAYQPSMIYEKEDTNMESLQLIYPEAFGVYKNPNVGSEKKPKLLVLCDSYLLNYIDYFGDNFSEIICVHAYDALKLPTLVNMYQPDILVFENVERAMTVFYPKDYIKNWDIVE